MAEAEATVKQGYAARARDGGTADGRTRALDPKKETEQDAAPSTGQQPGGEDPIAERKRRRRSTLIRLVFGLVLLVAVVVGVIYWLAGRNDVDTDDAYTDGRAISIAPRVSGYVVELDVNDNQFVHQGDVLIRIDPRDYQAARDQQAGSVAIA